MSSGLVEIKVDGGAECKSGALFQLTSPTDDFLSLFGITPSTSGVEVSPAVALGVPAIAAAVAAISEALGQIDADVYAVDGGANTPAKDHPAYQLLNVAATDWQSGSSLREQLTFDALLFGNGYAAITREEGVPVELHRLNPARTFMLVHPDTMEPVYRYSPLDGTEIDYSYSEIIHLRAPSLNGVQGESPVIRAKNAFGLSIVMEQHAARLFANGARPSGILSTKKTLTPDARTNLKNSIAANQAGRSSGQTLVLDEDMQFQQVSLSATDSQFLELRTFQINEIARVFRINPILLGEMGHATFSNASEMGRQFISYTLSPWVKRWEDEITLKLFDRATRAGFKVTLDTDGFDRDAINLRAQAYSALIAARVLNPNEARAEEGYPPFPGGDEFLNPHITTTEATIGG